ncbi:MAG: nucleotidyl transferase AbiEii/AbiGii toxin family protein [Chromatiaceae bacterium]|nr:nucleotidyl transferase AbiEii/AbiGii toxin family protein [Chromatiaceae bacterium]MBP6806864.1 nucleotidyl transferase AbiEii/AbiGii toxin family protein [Chromatiaceae bacterium]
MTGPDIGASIRARLLNKAKAEGQDFNLVLTRYALERLLYRLGSSSHAERFLLKGALLFDLWFDIPHRPTRDVDLLGFGPAEIPILEAVFRDLCAAASEPDDGICFQAETVRGGEIRKEANYAGIRVTLVGLLAGARCPVQVDVGFGDAVTPAPEPVNYPVMLPELPAPRLRAYPRYTVVAEKLDALVTLGIANSRMKDYFDLWVLARQADFDGDILTQAIRATFDRRATPLPDGVPFGLTEDFARDRQKQVQWRAFLAKNALQPVPLAEVLDLLRHLLMPPLNAARADALLIGQWLPGGDWR